MSLKLKLRPAKTLETLNLAREHQLPADPCANRTFGLYQGFPKGANRPQGGDLSKLVGENL